ncbi:MAG: DUF4252 domain-containing protein [Dysgonamonadaceae bacterium]|jgi:hypothetical protein|nr:DUF4252 domain-containing protein [Dysgonamonadaceae bacterium]
MKNLRKYGLFLFFVQWGVVLEAQELISSFLNEYGKDNRLEVVTIGKKMLGTMSGLSSGREDLSELQAAIKGLENIYIVTSKDTTLNDTILNREYYDSCRQLMKNTGFNVIFSGNEDPEGLFVIGTKESKGAVKELALLFLDKDGRFNLIQMTGVIDLNMLVKYSENLKGLNINKQ